MVNLYWKQRSYCSLVWFTAAAVSGFHLFHVIIIYFRKISPALQTQTQSTVSHFSKSCCNKHSRILHFYSRETLLTSTNKFTNDKCLTLELNVMVKSLSLFCFFQHWEAFQQITEIFILVPALLGLKGNLEMTLASRLSTAVSQQPSRNLILHGHTEKHE